MRARSMKKITNTALQNDSNAGAGKPQRPKLGLRPRIDKVRVVIQKVSQHVTKEFHSPRIFIYRGCKQHQIAKRWLRTSRMKQEDHMLLLSRRLKLVNQFFITVSLCMKVEISILRLIAQQNTLALRNRSLGMAWNS